MINRLHFSTGLAALLALQPLAFAQLSAAEPGQAASDAGSSGQKSTTAKTDKDKPKEKKICHREVPTGSITPVRICRTQAEIDAAAQRGQDEIDNANRMSQHQTQGLRG